MSYSLFVKFSVDAVAPTLTETVVQATNYSNCVSSPSSRSNLNDKPEIKKLRH